MSELFPNFTLSELDSRAREVFRDIVESYLETGQPVGSKTVALSGGRHLSPATIRNTMAELSRCGLLASPHVSAGRIPTQAGLRLFVDGLLEIGDLAQSEQRSLEAKLAARKQPPHQSANQYLEQASGMLAGLAGGAGLVLTPSAAPIQSPPLRHVEFVALDDGQALVVLVYEDGRIENRLMPRPEGLLPASLERAGNFLSARLKGRRLEEARADILAEIAEGSAQIDQAATGLIEQGLASWAGESNTTNNKRALIVRGRAQLLDNLEAQTDLERIRLLFEDLERKEELIALLDRTEEADGVKIFIGTENPLFSLSGSSLVVAPYRDAAQNVLGAVGVIGPTRLNYARVIPMVDYTAQLVGRWLDQK